MNEVALLSTQKNLIEEFAEQLSDYKVESFKNDESLKAESIELLFVDAAYIHDFGNMQFFLSKIRKKLNNTPVVLVFSISSLKEVDTEWYFNDFIVYPFRKGELVLRVKKHLQNKSLSSKDDIIKINKLLINKKEYSVFLDGKRIDFTYKEFELLCLLIENKGIVFSRSELLRKIWGVEYIGGTRTVDVHIRRLRSKLGMEFNSIIETIRNVGYRCIE